MIRPDRPRRAGFTYSEIALSTFLSGVVVVAAMNCVAMTQRTRQKIQTQRDAGALARALLTEMSQMRYREPDTSPSFGRESGEGSSNRLAWDDVDDYLFLSENPPENRDGTPVAGYTGWRRSVAVAFVQLSNPGSISLTDTGLKGYTVYVTPPGGSAISYTALRSREGVMEAAPAASTTNSTWTGIDMTVGPNSERVITGVQSINSAN